MQVNQLLQNAKVADSTAVDNGTATATCATAAEERAYLTGFIASFSAAVALIKTITITYTGEDDVAKSIVIAWDFANGPAIVSLPGICRAKTGGDITVALAASGTGGTTGRVYAFYALG